jgi:hypothetical protein
VQHDAKRFASFRDDVPIPPATAVLMPEHCNRIHRLLECDVTVVVKVDVDADCDANHILIGRSSARLGARMRLNCNDVRRRPAFQVASDHRSSSVQEPLSNHQAREQSPSNGIDMWRSSQIEPAISSTLPFICDSP